MGCNACHKGGVGLHYIACHPVGMNNGIEISARLHRETVNLKRKSSLYYTFIAGKLA
jgi:hypothetical protein